MLRDNGVSETSQLVAVGCVVVVGVFRDCWDWSGRIGTAPGDEGDSNDYRVMVRRAEWTCKQPQI